jgi:hypothetical protein
LDVLTARVKVTPVSAVLWLLLLIRRLATGVVVRVEAFVTGSVTVVKWPWLLLLMEATVTVQMVLLLPLIILV